MSWPRLLAMPMADLYPAYVQKVERKGRSREELDEVVCWLTGYTADELARRLQDGTTVAAFFAEAPAINPNAHLITGVVCGVRVEDIEDAQQQRVRWLDKLVDELARGKAMEKVLRAPFTSPH